MAIFAAATDAFSRKNINQSVDESLATYKGVCDRALAEGCACADTSRLRSGARIEGEVAPAASPPTSRSGSPIWACSKWR